MSLPHIIILNGIGSAGKTSLARAFQNHVATPFLHVQMDAFLDMLPPASEGRPDGLVFEQREEAGHTVVHIRSGPTVALAMRAFRACIAAMAGQGTNLIVDDVIFGPEWREYDRLLAGHHVTKIGVLCPLDILEAREAVRPDRLVGLARGQWNRIDHTAPYDLTLDTSTLTPEQAAAQIARHLSLEPAP